MISLLIAALSCVIWLYLIGARGKFWQVVPASVSSLGPAPAPRIAVIVPARNEAAVIAQAVLSLLQQDYPGPLHIFVVDDHSSDGTGELARNASAAKPESLTVVSAAPLPSGWTGKMWALAQGVEHSADFAPDYFLFTDADIVHGPESIRSSVALAQAGNRDLVSFMVKLRCESVAEQALIPAFVFFFFLLYPPEWVNRDERRTAAAAGGDILVRAEALARIGGISTIRNELIDDCALAREVKRGGMVSLGLTEHARSIRPYGTFAVIGRMISRTAFYQLRHSVWLLIATFLGLGITYLAPPVLVFFGGSAALFAGVAWMLMTISYWPMVRYYRVSALWAAMLPLIAGFYALATMHSAIQYWTGRGGDWKGRVQDTRPA